MNIRLIAIMALTIALVSCGKTKNLLGPETVGSAPSLEIYSVNTSDQVYSRLRPGVLENLWIKVRNNGNTTLTGLKATLDFSNPYAAKYPAPSGMTSYFRSQDGSDYLLPGEVSEFGMPNDENGAWLRYFPSYYVQTGNPFQNPTVEFTLKVADNSGGTWDLKFYLTFR